MANTTSPGIPASTQLPFDATPPFATSKPAPSTGTAMPTQPCAVFDSMRGASWRSSAFAAAKDAGQRFEIGSSVANPCERMPAPRGHGVLVAWRLSLEVAHTPSLLRSVANVPDAALGAGELEQLCLGPVGLPEPFPSVGAQDATVDLAVEVDGDSASLLPRQGQDPSVMAPRGGQASARCTMGRVDAQVARLGGAASEPPLRALEVPGATDVLTERDEHELPVPQRAKRPEGGFKQGASATPVAVPVVEAREPDGEVVEQVLCLLVAAVHRLQRFRPEPGRFLYRLGRQAAD